MIGADGGRVSMDSVLSRFDDDNLLSGFLQIFVPVHIFLKKEENAKAEIDLNFLKCIYKYYIM